MSEHTVAWPRRKRPQLNIVPLVDVLIILIFFFLVTMQFKDVSTLNLTLPSLETAGSNQSTFHLAIAVDREGVFYVNRLRVSEKELQEAIALAGRLQKESRVLLVADEETPLKTVTMVMDQCRLHGLENIKLQSR